MADWTNEQVLEWLTREGFGRFCQNFKDCNMTGADLLTLRTKTIRQLLSSSDGDEIPTEQLIDQLKQKLHEWKRQFHQSSTDRRASSAVRATSSITTSDVSSYTKNLTLSPDKIGIYGKIFHNPKFRTRFQECLTNTHQLYCQIQVLESQEIYLTLSGDKPNVKSAREMITNLFQSVQIKTYDNEETDQQMIYWSQNIVSDNMLPVLQYIMDQQNIYTLWEKTAMFYGHLKVNYFTDQWFTVSEKQIMDILKNEILYIENLPMPDEKTVNFLKTIDQYRSTRQHPELAMIYCKYPYKVEIKLSLFGRKNLVKKANKQLQSIVNKYTVRIFPLKINDYQHEYLLDHCSEEMKSIEEKYKDDCVKIRIRQKNFSAPQYLVEIIRHKINELMFHILTCQYQKMGDSFILTTEQHQQIQKLVRSYYCRIEKMETQTSVEIYSIPKALSPASNVSSLIIEQSREFTARLSVRKIVVSNGSIEIHLIKQATLIPKDVAIITSPTAAVEEGIEHMNDDRYVELRDGRKIVFQRWSPIAVVDEKTNKKLKKSVGRFIFDTFQCLTSYCPDVKTIAFLTSEWENIASGQQSLVEYMINDVKQELEMRKMPWRILFIMTNGQRDLYGEFTQVFNRLQSDRDRSSQFACPITILQITLAAAWMINLQKCEKELKKIILADTSLTNEADLQQWDQYTINVFFKYCLSQSVLPTMDLTTHLEIRLIGPISAVEKSIEKYRLMTEILKQRSDLRNPPPTTPRISVRGEKIPSDAIGQHGLNIYFSFCRSDRGIANRIITHLTAEGYSVSQTPSNSSAFQTLIDQSDVVLIAFSTDYSQNIQSRQEVKYARSTRKKLIPFVIRPMTDENAWLSSITLADLFYELFDTEIKIEFKTDFDLEYDRLLSVLLHHTKPGIIGRTYPQPAILPKISSETEDYERAAFGHPSLALQKITPVQRQERERAYQQEVASRMEREKFSEEEINNLFESLLLVSDDLEAIIRGEDPDAELFTDEHDSNRIHYRTASNAHEFLTCIQRWLNRAPNVIRANILPFTPTGDINDAIFIIHRTADDHQYERVYESMDTSPPDKYFSVIPNSGWNLSNEQTHEYFQKLIQSTKPIGFMDMAFQENDTTEKPVSSQAEDGTDTMINEHRSPQEMRKLEELDDPNRIWKMNQYTKKRMANGVRVRDKKEFNEQIKKFMNEKHRNVLQWKEFDEKRR